MQHAHSTSHLTHLTQHLHTMSNVLYHQRGLPDDVRKANTRLRKRLSKQRERQRKAVHAMHANVKDGTAQREQERVEKEQAYIEERQRRRLETIEQRRLKYKEDALDEEALRQLEQEAQLHKGAVAVRKAVVLPPPTERTKRIEKGIATAEEERLRHERAAQLLSTHSEAQRQAREAQEKRERLERAAADDEKVNSPLFLSLSSITLPSASGSEPPPAYPSPFEQDSPSNSAVNLEDEEGQPKLGREEGGIQDCEEEPEGADVEGEAKEDGDEGQLQVEGDGAGTEGDPDGADSTNTAAYIGSGHIALLPVSAQRSTETQPSYPSAAPVTPVSSMAALRLSC